MAPLADSPPFFPENLERPRNFLCKWFILNYFKSPQDRRSVVMSWEISSVYCIPYGMGNLNEEQVQLHRARARSYQDQLLAYWQGFKLLMDPYDYLTFVRRAMAHENLLLEEVVDQPQTFKKVISTFQLLVGNHLYDSKEASHNAVTVTSQRVSQLETQ